MDNNQMASIRKPGSSKSLVASLTTRLTGSTSCFPGNMLSQAKPRRSADAHLVKEWADAAESGDTDSFRHLMKEMGVDRRNFKKNIREHEGFKSAIASIGGFEWAANKHYTAFCKN